MFNRKPDLSERSRLRQSRARPWLINSVISKAKKVVCKTTTVEAPNSAVGARNTPPPKSPETLVFEEALKKHLENLSRQARPSRIPRRVQKSPLKGCLKGVSKSSNEKSKMVPTCSPGAHLRGGEKQVKLSRLPLSRQLVERRRGKGATGTTTSPGLVTRRCGTFVSQLSDIGEVSESGSSLDLPSDDVKFTSKVVKKVHFAFGHFERRISSRKAEREWAPSCLIHDTCKELTRENGFRTCMKSEEDGAKTPNFAVWHDDQLKKGHDYFSEYGDVLGKTFVTDVDGAILEDSDGTPLRDLEAINSL